MSTSQTIDIILIIAAIICFAVAAVAGGPHADGAGWRRTNYVAVGLALWAITVLISLFPK